MSSKKSKKTKAVSQNDLRKMMMDMKNKRSTKDVKSTPIPTHQASKKEAKASITNPDVLKKALKDRMRINSMLSESQPEVTKSLKRTQNQVSPRSAENEKPPDPKVAKVEKNGAKAASKTGIMKQAKKETKPLGSLGLGSYGSDSEEEEPATETVKKSVTPPKPEKMETETTEPQTSDSVLPEGFFDNPEVDAKMRGVETPANKMDKEWEKFQIEMQHEAGHSEQIVDEEQELGNIDRQLEEIDEQIELYSRVEKLNDVRDEIKQKADKTKKMDVSDSDEDSGSDLDDSATDWREKDAFL